MSDQQAPSCPSCGSEQTEYRHDHNDPEDPDGGIPEGTPVYKCGGCLGYFPETVITTE